MPSLDSAADFRPDDSWCRRLGNFASPGWRMPAAPRRAAEPMDIAPRAPANRETRAALRTQMLQVAFGAAAAAALVASMPASAQMGGGMGGHAGHGGHGPNSSTPSANKPDADPAHVPNPLRAMLAEMPKMRADLLLTSQQLGPWSTMESALRDSVDLGRDRLVATGSPNGPDPALFVQALADNEHAFSEALTRFAGSMNAALAVLNPRQAKLVHERFAAAIDAELPGGNH